MKTKFKHFSNSGFLKNRLENLLLLAGLIFLVAMPSVMKAQLSGTYTICSSGCDYSTVSSAVSDLSSNGVSGAVVFNLGAESFNEAISINGVSGVSATNTVTFKGQGQSSTNINYAYSNVISLNSCYFLSFSDMTIEEQNINNYSNYNCVYSINDSNCTFSNCTFKCPAFNQNNYYNYDYGVYSQNDLNFTISNCSFIGGEVGFYNQSYNYNSNSIRVGNLKITKCNFTNQVYGIISYYDNYYYYYYNYSYMTQLENEYSENVFDCANNLNYSYSRGLLTEYENGGVIKNNVFKPGMYIDLYVYTPLNTDSNTKTMVYNNMCSNFTGVGIYVYNDGYYYYYYNNSQSYNSHIVVAHNTCYADANTSPYYGILAYNYNYYNNSGTSTMDILNNISVLKSSSSSYSMYLYNYNYYSNTNFGNIDGNDVYNAGSYIAMYNGTSYSTYSAYKSAMTSNYGFEGSSSNVVPTFVSSSDLHLTSSSAVPTGINAGISTDIDGDTRSTTAPTAGADEGNPCTLTSASITAGGATTFCDGGSVVLSTGTANTYSWSNQNGPILGASGSTYTATTSGTYYVTLSNGANCTVTSPGTTVTVNPNPVASATASPTTVFYGYTTAYNTSVLSGSSDISGSSYSWTSNPSGYTSSASGGSVAPSSTTTYYLNVTSPAGCNSNTASVKVNVIDVRCGNNNDKVLICHNCNSICIASSAVAAHLANHAGDKLGTCGACQSKPEEEFENQVGIYPNPFSNSTNLRMIFVKDQQIAVELYSVDGKLIRSIFAGDVTAHSAYNFDIDGSTLTPGIYFVKINTDNSVDFRRIEMIR